MRERGLKAGGPLRTYVCVHAEAQISIDTTGYDTQAGGCYAIETTARRLIPDLLG